MREELDKRWRDLGEFIREQRRGGQLSLRKLSELAGVSNPYLSQIERGLRRPSADILQQIARALEISSETLYVRAGILDEPETTVDPLVEIRRDGRLSEDQKKSIVRIYESFLKENGVVETRIAAAPRPVVAESVLEVSGPPAAEPELATEEPAAHSEVGPAA